MRLLAVAAAMIFINCSQFAAAQKQTPNAALQARARFLEGHQRSGSMGNGYRPWSAWTYQESARRHAEALNTYGKHVKQLPAATAKEHLEEIRKNVTASKAEIAKLGDEAAKEADVKNHVDALTKYLMECEQLCASMEKTIGKDGVETVKMCAHCSGLIEKLTAAEKEHRALLKKLGLEPPTSPADHSGSNPEKAGVAPAKKVQ
jgi:molecular chaperone DnaK (HSP70)